MDETPRSSRSRLRAAVVIIAIATAIIALVAAAVAFYGIQTIDFDEARCAFQGHFAEFDALVSPRVKALVAEESIELIRYQDL